MADNPGSRDENQDLDTSKAQVDGLTSEPTPGIKNRVMTVWGLYLASAVIGITAPVGLVLAYIWRSEATGTLFSDHYAKQITTFWITFIGVLVSLPLMLIGIGFLTPFAIIIYFLVISVLGLIRANENRPYGNGPIG